MSCKSGRLAGCNDSRGKEDVCERVEIDEGLGDYYLCFLFLYIGLIWFGLAGVLRRRIDPSKVRWSWMDGSIEPG